MIKAGVVDVKKEEVWAVSIERARAFFRDQMDVEEVSPGVYTFCAVRIGLEELEPSNAGIFSACRTRLVMDGPEEAVKSIHHRFFTNFLSAGG